MISLVVTLDSTGSCQKVGALSLGHSCTITTLIQDLCHLKPV